MHEHASDCPRLTVPSFFKAFSRSSRVSNSTKQPRGFCVSLCLMM